MAALPWVPRTTGMATADAVVVRTAFHRCTLSQPGAKRCSNVQRGYASTLRGHRCFRMSWTQLSSCAPGFRTPSLLLSMALGLRARCSVQPRWSWATTRHCLQGYWQQLAPSRLGACCRSYAACVCMEVFYGNVPLCSFVTLHCNLLIQISLCCVQAPTAWEQYAKDQPSGTLPLWIGNSDRVSSSL